AQYGRLHVVQAGVDAWHLVMIAVDLSAVAQPLHPVGQRAVVGDHRSAVAERAEVLRRVEAESAGDADGADRRTTARRQMRLAAVLDDGEAVTRGDALDSRHVGRLAV